MKKATLTREINKKYRFKIEIDDHFVLDYTSRELKWSEFGKKIAENIKYLEALTHEFWTDELVEPWKKLQGGIGSLHIHCLLGDGIRSEVLGDLCISEMGIIAMC